MAVANRGLAGDRAKTNGRAQNLLWSWDNTNSVWVPVQDDGLGNVLMSLGTGLAGEDLTNDLIKTEHRYTPFRVTADGQVKAGAGLLHSIEIAATGTVTAGVITIYDSTTETGTILLSFTVNVATPLIPVPVNKVFSTGLYIGYDATIANVQVSGSYR